MVISIILLSACVPQKSTQDTLNEENSFSEETRKKDEKTDIEYGEVESEKPMKNIEEQDENQVSVSEFTDDEKREMTQLFYEWAIERAKIGNLAVTKMYFQHGAAGSGDWYALTSDGEVQVQDLNNPGFDYFDIHAVGGVAFYTPLSGDYGEDENAPFPGIAEGYHRLAVPDTHIHKYMLADNGTVYELIAKKENMGSSTGFGEYDDDGTVGDLTPTVEFKISEDEAAQDEWEKILNRFK